MRIKVVYFISIAQISNLRSMLISIVVLNYNTFI